jgi:hypothetical protein
MTITHVKNIANKLQQMHPEITILLASPGFTADIDPICKQKPEILVVYSQRNAHQAIPDEALVKTSRTYRCKLISLQTFVKNLEQADITAIHIAANPFTVAVQNCMGLPLYNMQTISYIFFEGYAYKHYQDILHDYRHWLNIAKQTTSKTEQIYAVSIAYYWASVLSIFHQTKDLETALLLVGEKDKILSQIQKIQDSKTDLLKSTLIMATQANCDHIAEYADSRKKITKREQHIIQDNDITRKQLIGQLYYYSDQIKA